ncbi:thiamine pyrophosphate-dependent enzyme [Agriterribacter sp.]|uniref:alpha-ketoacid dehydrogenase subunit alpha/beta n=1 Tax=Agriterribacter sp. TaxID=2821509 RepID=UPI002C8C14D3|nr:thiamine pyrophosphate-dependent enzyme [Agriterribacter sp.]HRO45927.1 thiamine pyrophosphate-dependent enzyme [Agriterribacter sp.]HRQ18385.1 thiamine pyrophosphate-dependent enzyme [Agriterribacter sp.]
MEHIIPNDILSEEKLSFDRFREEVLNDYRLACESREASLLGRKEVLTGKAKFGIFGDGKEVPQIALSKFFQPGDFYAGYYRDQTIAFATETATIEDFFAQLYANPDEKDEPHSAGRQMNAHFASSFVDEHGEFLDLINHKNITSGIAPTAGQMPRALGLAFASKVFREVEQLRRYTSLSDNGNEVCFCTIGDASTSEGHFWETVNAAAVLEVPLAIFIWDDGYGISVPSGNQIVKGSISDALKGFQKKGNSTGIDIYKVKCWDYAGLCEIFEQGIQKVRDTHIPAVFHVEEVTQPQGHSTSGSHERYKTADRLEWEREWDCIKKMKEWIIANALAEEEELNAIEINAKSTIKTGRQLAWDKYTSPIKAMLTQTISVLQHVISAGKDHTGRIQVAVKSLQANREPDRRDILKALATGVNFSGDTVVQQYYNRLLSEQNALYHSHLYNEGTKSLQHVQPTALQYNENAPLLNGYQILNRYFDELFANNPKVLAFGEDLGLIGDVNQGFAGLQQKHGDKRIFDTGIRELTIMGQGIGLAMRGLRPIAEIQYVDYMLYGLQPLSDDAASLHYRTKGKQSCPIIVRTRGHRLEGIWHSGSPMGMLINALRGFHVCVPRNMVQAAGMYNTLLEVNDPAIMIECLNAYRLKEKLPSDLLNYRVALGVPEIIKEGSDITIVSYGATLRIAHEAAILLDEMGASCEVIDVQTLLPFDINNSILDSLKKTSRIIFADEDLPGGAAAYMFNMVMEMQGGYRWLDVAPRTITAQPHRPAYGTDGDYFSKPNVEDFIRVVKEMMSE